MRFPGKADAGPKPHPTNGEEGIGPMGASRGRGACLSMMVSILEVHAGIASQSVCGLAGKGSGLKGRTKKYNM